MERFDFDFFPSRIKSISGNGNFFSTVAMNGTIRIWNIDFLHCQKIFHFSQENVLTSCMGPDVLVICSSNNDFATLYAYSVEQFQISETFVLDCLVSSMVMSAGEKRIVTFGKSASGHQSISIWDTSSGNKIWSWVWNPLQLSNVPGKKKESAELKRVHISLFPEGRIGLASANHAEIISPPKMVSMQLTNEFQDGKRISKPFPPIQRSLIQIFMGSTNPKYELDRFNRGEIEVDTMSDWVCGHLLIMIVTMEPNTVAERQPNLERKYYEKLDKFQTISREDFEILSSCAVEAKTAGIITSENVPVHPRSKYGISFRPTIDYIFQTLLHSTGRVERLKECVRLYANEKETFRLVGIALQLIGFMYEIILARCPLHECFDGVDEIDHQDNRSVMVVTDIILGTRSTLYNEGDMPKYFICRIMREVHKLYNETFMDNLEASEKTKIMTFLESCGITNDIRNCLLCDWLASPQIR